MLMYSLLFAIVAYIVIMALLKIFLKVSLENKFIIPSVIFCILGALFIVFFPELSLLTSIFVGIILPCAAIILLAIFFQIKEMEVKVEDKKIDQISPYLIETQKLKQSSLDNSTKLLALGKVARHFFRNILKLENEKSFDEIQEIAEAPKEIKDFCEKMATLPYTGEEITKQDINKLYDDFEKIFRKNIDKIDSTAFVKEKKEIKKEKIIEKKEEQKPKIEQKPLEDSLKELNINVESKPKPLNKPAETAIETTRVTETRGTDIEEKLRKIEEKLREKVKQKKRVQEDNQEIDNLSEIEKDSREIEAAALSQPRIKIIREIKETPVYPALPKRTIEKKEAEHKEEIKQIKSPPKKIAEIKGRIKETDKINNEIKELQARIEGLVENELEEQLSQRKEIFLKKEDSY